MTEIITGTNHGFTAEDNAKALLVRLAIESKYCSPNGGYVSKFNQCVTQPNAESELGCVPPIEQICCT